MSIVGLSLTFREARKARDAAQQANAQVTRVVALVRSRTRLATLASAIPQVDLMLQRVEQNALRNGHESLTALRRSLIEARLGVAITAIRDQDLFQPALGELDAVDKLIWSEADDKAKKFQMATMLQRVRTAVMEPEVNAKAEAFT